jgi:hypothetical protein
LDSVTQIAERWFLRVLEQYPEQTAQFLRTQPDPFRNPVGAAIRQGLPVLVRQALGEAGPEEVRQALDSIIRIRAVQDISAREAAGFVFLLREVLDERGSDSRVQRRIDDLALAVFDVYVQCREKIAEIRANESVRARLVR